MKRYRTTALVGTQWGDEGKGKVIDILAAESDMVVRSQGGNNAGHTVIVGENVYKLQLIPSGILYKGCECVIGAGTVIDPKALLAEMDKLRLSGIGFENLHIDGRAQIVLPYHLLIDQANEIMRGKSSIGTTKKGIGPCYMDKAERIGIRMQDALDLGAFAEKLKRNLEIKKRWLQSFYQGSNTVASFGVVPLKDSKSSTVGTTLDTVNVDGDNLIGGFDLDFDTIFAKYSTYLQRLAPYIKDTSVLVYKAIRAGKKVLFEGAQGTLLDLTFGTYPYVTSSHPIIGGIATGAGIGPNMIGECLGIAKAYTTRVGSGPFVTELLDEIGQRIQTLGKEFGTVTGRARRCGWLDAVILRYSVRINGLTSLCVNKLDTLSGIKTLKICKGYWLDNQLITELPIDLKELERCKPQYIELDGWEENLENITEFAQLPNNAQLYICTIEKLIDCPITMIGVGADRMQNIVR